MYLNRNRDDAGPFNLEPTHGSPTKASGKVLKRVQPHSEFSSGGRKRSLWDSENPAHTLDPTSRRFQGSSFLEGLSMEARTNPQSFGNAGATIRKW